MSYESIRQSVISSIKAPFEAAFPGVAVVYDNAPFNFDSPPDFYVEFEVKFYGGQQIGMSAAPRTRVSGFVYVTATARRGTGVKRVQQALDWFASNLEYKSFGGVLLQAAEPDGDGGNQAWYTESVKVGFYKDP